MKLKTEAGCVLAHEILNIAKAIKDKTINTFDVDVSVMGEIVSRKMIKTLINNDIKFVDIITGTTYDPKTGSCNSSKVFIKRVYKNRSKK